MAFIIDKDHIADPEARPGTYNNAVGLVGPRSYEGDGMELTIPFRMRDDDRELYYEGRVDLLTYEENPFQPLDCFGEPNAGATIIEYKDAHGQWRAV